MERVVQSGVGPEFLRSEANGSRSREAVVLANAGGSAITLLAGTVLGLISIGALSAAGAAVAGNTGAATITAEPPVATGTPTGVYRLTAISAGATAEWLMASPEGVILGNVTTGTPASIGGIGPFTITDEGTDPAIGDQFTITVTAAAATNDGRYVIHDPEGTDGRQTAAAILYDTVDVPASGTADATAVVRDAEIIPSRLVWDDHEAGEKAAALAQLAALGLIARD